jgi:alanyl-tRNA synthetase
MMTSAAIRKTFLEFFRSKGHQIVPSAPIVIKNDPTLMFTNAGMNQFKEYFLGNKPAPYPRIADTQKCLRVSGKHNDLEEVGVDTYHHTMFEMLGNWSFGDYFKNEAIEWSWELLTEVFQIPIDRLYVTVFEGDEKEGLPPSKIALVKWKSLIAEDHIVFGNKKDNFWEMGDVGPCGPCTEIHVDMRPEEERAQVPGRNLVNKDNPQVIEIWNNVFIQYNRLKDGSLEPLPQRHVDTGMGFERLVRVLQGKRSNYDTDVFSGTITEIERLTSKTYDYSDSKQAVAFRVLADHIRAISFTIADGQLPSNTGAGYVIRRILRRAVRYYYSYLDFQQPLLYQLVPVLATQFEEVFPELKQQETFVSKVIREEEDAFLRTLGRGIDRFSNYVLEKTNSISGYVMGGTNEETGSDMKMQQRFANERSNKIVAGEFAFELNDTYGFPVDLTELMARENGWTVDIEGFHAEMQKQKARSRAATATDAGDWIVINEGNPEFVGYDLLETRARILRYRTVKRGGKEVYQVVLDKTPFYAESGGQVGDMGVLKSSAATVNIIDTKRENDLVIHFTERLPESAAEELLAVVDSTRRKRTAVHHSATHLLHAALRQVLGTHVAQKGSLVNADHLRFDFSHFSKVTSDELETIERLVNEKIRQNIPVVIRQLPKDEALQAGAMALFGEKYGDTVRVVTIDPEYSIELCGGTHVGATGELGFFKILSESAVAAGVRRIEAVSGVAAEQYLHGELKKLQQVAEALKQPKDLLKAVQYLQTETATLQKRLETFEASGLRLLRDQLLQKAQTINGATFIGAVVDVNSADALKKLAFELKAKAENFVIALAAPVAGKAQVVLLFDEGVAAQKNLDAAATIKKEIAPLIKGGGGGQRTLATAGGQNSTDLQTVIEGVKKLL